MYIYSTQLYFTDLPVREASQCLSLIIKRNHVSIQNWIRKNISKKKKFRKPEFIVDETVVNAGNEDVLPWMAIELSDKIIPGIRISIERLEACCKIIPSKFNYKIRKTQYNRLMVGLLQTCRFLNILSHLHSVI